MRRWPVVAVRVFGGLHILMSLLGGVLIVWTLVVDIPSAVKLEPAFPYRIHIYIVDTIFCILCLVFLANAGSRLWRLEPRGVWLSNVVLSFEIMWYMVGAQAVSLLLTRAGMPKLIGSSIVTAGGIGEIGITPQILTGYPLIALIVTNIAYGRLDKVPGSAHGAHP